MKLSLITVCRNAEYTIAETVESVIAQAYPDLEYIVIDGASSDGTLEVLNRYAAHISILISEQDAGMYDALNKGIARATGDVIGILNADDVFAHPGVLHQIADKFTANPGLDALIGDVAFKNNSGGIIRRYRSGSWNPNKFIWGFMPPHPSFYCKRAAFNTYGGYRTDFEIGADYELLVRFLKVHQLSYMHLPGTMVYMKPGGKSTRGLRSTLVINREIYRACRMHGVQTNYARLLAKYFVKIWEFLPA